MTVSLGSVTVDGSGAASGSGYCLDLYNHLLAETLLLDPLVPPSGWSASVWSPYATAANIDTKKMLGRQATAIATGTFDAYGTGGSGGGPTAYGVDAYTRHRWLLNDASGATTYADTGTVPLNATIVDTGAVRLGRVGPFADCAYLLGSGNGGGKTASETTCSTTALSLHAWVNVRVSGGAWQRIVGYRYATAWSAPYVCASLAFYSGSFAPFVDWSDVSGYHSASPPTYDGVISPGSGWHHVGGTLSHSGSTMQACTYVDGVQVAQQSIASGPIVWSGASDSGWMVASNAESLSIDGWMFDVRVDDGIARSASYFKALYKAGMGRSY